MTTLRLIVADEKHMLLSGIDPLVAACLQELPEILERRDVPAARARLFPPPTKSDAKINDEWEKLVTSDLRHLFVAAGDTVARDLTKLELEPGSPSLRLLLLAEHRDAWMSALNQARLILGEMFEIDESDLRPRDLDLRDPKRRAALTIEVLGHVLQLFVELEDRDEPQASV